MKVRSRWSVSKWGVETKQNTTNTGWIETDGVVICDWARCSSSWWPSSGVRKDDRWGQRPWSSHHSCVAGCPSSCGCCRSDRNRLASSWRDWPRSPMSSSAQPFTSIAIKWRRGRLPEFYPSSFVTDGLIPIIRTSPSARKMCRSGSLPALAASPLCQQIPFTLRSDFPYLCWLILRFHFLSCEAPDQSCHFSLGSSTLLSDIVISIAVMVKSNEQIPVAISDLNEWNAHH